MRRLLLIVLVPVLVVALGACGGGGGGGDGEARQPAGTTIASPAGGSPSGSVEEGLISPDSPLGKAPALATLEGGGRRVEVLALERNTPRRLGGPPAVAYAVYQLPPEVTRVAVTSRRFVGVTPPLPITQPRPDEPKVEDEPDAPTVAQSKGLVESLVSHVESATQRVTDQGNQVRIALNTDVLFAFDKADLTPAAQAELRRVADKVGAEASGTVQVTGHTDDVGSGSYNLDLSRRRAQSVHAVLAALLRGKALAFQVAGSGQTNLDFYAKGALVSRIGIEPLEVGYSSGEFYWMVLRDASRINYLVVNDTGKVCVCSQVGGLRKPLEPTESQRLWALLSSPPPSVRTVDVLFAGFPQPIRNVPIG